MTTSRRRSPRSTTSAATATSANGTIAPWSDAARHQMECGILAFVTVLKSAEAMHKFLLGNIHRARERHEAVRSRIHRADGVEELMALQVDLWRFDTDVANRYWEEVAEALTHMNAEVLDQSTHALDRWVDDAQRTVAEVAASADPGDDALPANAFTAFAKAVTTAVSAPR